MTTVDADLTTPQGEDATIMALGLQIASIQTLWLPGRVSRLLGRVHTPAMRFFTAGVW